MAARFAEDERKLDQESLLQTYRGNDMFVFTELLQFYLELGYEIRNIKLATQYLGENCLKPYITKAVKMRIDATYENDETKANTAKIFINSSYGKLLENPARHTRALLVEDRLLNRYMRKPTFNTWNQLDTEDGDMTINEIIMDKEKLNDHYPVHVGNAVLQHSKLHFLR